MSEVKASELSPMTFLGAEKAPMGEKGVQGLIVMDGMITNDEFNRELTGPDAITIYEKMRRGDGTVKAALLAVKLPILAAKWDLEPASDSTQDVFIRDFVKDNLFEGMTRTFSQTLREILRFLDYGVMIHEKIFENRVFEGQTYIGLKKLAPRMPGTVEKWNAGEGKDGITQNFEGKEYKIPIEKLLINVNEQIGDDWWGESMLRSAYRHWYTKDVLYKIDAIKHERQGIGVPYFKKPQNASPEDVKKARKLMKNLRGHEQAWIEMIEHWEFGFMDMHVPGTSDMMPSITHHDQKILLSVLAQFLSLGSDKETGSFALSRDHSSLFYLALQAVADQVAQALDRFVIKQLVDINFSVTEYPTMRYDALGSTDFGVLAEALSKLTGAKLLMPEVSLEQFLRNAMNLPELDEEVVKQRLEVEKIQAEKAIELATNPPTPPTNGGNNSGDNPDDVQASEHKFARKMLTYLERELEYVISQKS